MYKVPSKLSRENKFCIVSTITADAAARFGTGMEPFEYYFSTPYGEAVEYFDAQSAQDFVTEATLFCFFTGTTSKFVKSTNPAIAIEAKKIDKAAHEALYGEGSYYEEED